MARKMKDSGIEWIGEIPEGWEVAPLKRFTSIQTGNTPSKTSDSNYYASTGIPWIKPDNLGYSHSISKTSEHLTSEGALCARIMPPNTVYVCCIGSLGKVGYSSISCACNQQINALIFNDLMFWKYGYYLTIAQESQYLLLGNGNVLQIINSTSQGNIACVLPPLENQHLIACYLDSVCSDIEVLISKTRSSIEEYKKLKQAVITQAITKGVRGERKMKDSGVEWIGEIPKEWVCEKIKYATSISRGLFNHRPRNDERYYNGKYPFIQTGDVANATKYIVSYSQTLNELGKSVSKEFPKGTLTMTIAANVGDVAILNFNAYFPDSVVGFIPNKNIRTLYLFYVFSAMKDEFTRTAIKSTQLNLNIDRVKETFIPVTLNVNEQCEIENYLESKCAEIDELIAKKEQLVKELESYKKSLIYEVVTGKREV